MAAEIERKFLVRDDTWRVSVATTEPMRQGYLASSPECNVRIRLAGDRAWLTIKGRTVGATRPEYEYAIPPAEAAELLERLCLRPQIEKTRHRVPYAGHCFEVDVFHGANEGLVLCEVELGSEGEVVELPPWLGREVTGDPRYFNARLALRPYTTWPETEV